MSVITEIAAKLQALAYGTVGTDIFDGSLQEDPDVQIAVKPAGGLPPQFGFGAAGVQFETPGVMIQVRGVAGDFLVPYARAKSIHDALTAIETTTLSGTFYHWIHPQGPPYEQSRDGKGRVIFAVICLCEKDPS